MPMEDYVQIYVQFPGMEFPPHGIVPIYKLILPGDGCEGSKPSQLST